MRKLLAEARCQDGEVIRYYEAAPLPTGEPWAVYRVRIGKRYVKAGILQSRISQMLADIRDRCNGTTIDYRAGKP